MTVDYTEKGRKQRESIVETVEIEANNSVVGHGVFTQQDGMFSQVGSLRLESPIDFSGLDYFKSSTREYCVRFKEKISDLEAVFRIFGSQTLDG